MRKERNYRCIGIHEAEGLLGRKPLLILDVRDADAFAKSHIHGAQHVTVGNLFPIVNSTSRRIPVLIYCYHGHASREYAKIFAEHDFTEVYSLNGGFETWNAWMRASAGWTARDRRREKFGRLEKLELSNC